MPASTIESTESIRKFHNLGQQVLQEDKNVGTVRGGRYHRGAISAVKRAIGNSRSESYLHTARMFAAMYPTTKELDWFCHLGQQKGKPLTCSHAQRLTAVKEKSLRNRLAERCARESWSVVRLTAEIQSLRGKRDYGGRRPERPANQRAALVELERMASRWVRWVDEFQVEDPRGVKLPQSVRMKLEEATTRIRKLCRAVDGALGNTSPAVR